MLPCVCSVINNRGRQNVVRTSVTHSAAPRVPLLCSYHILTSSVISYWTDAQQLIYIYIYIYIHLFTKTLLFQKYISYICITVEKILKQGGHISSVIPLRPLVSVFYIYVFSDVDKKDTSEERRKGIIIYMTYILFCLFFFFFLPFRKRLIKNLADKFASKLEWQVRKWVPGFRLMIKKGGQN